MDAVRGIATIGKYLGDPTRAAMLAALLDGRAWTSGELAGIAGVSASTASTHLAKLYHANLIQIEKQGRHRYHVLANEEVARAIESLTSLAMRTKSTQHRYHSDQDPLHFARSCYDHLAGALSVQLVSALIDEKLLLDTGTEYSLTEKGVDKLSCDLKINIKNLILQRRSFSRKCLDYSVRRHHIAGSLGQALFESFINLGWLIKEKNTRRVIVTTKGYGGFQKQFGMNF